MVARSGVRVPELTRCEAPVRGFPSVPPGGGGALFAAALLRTLFRAFVFLPPTVWWGKASP